MAEPRTSARNDDTRFTVQHITDIGHLFLKKLISKDNQRQCLDAELSYNVLPGVTKTIVLGCTVRSEINRSGQGLWS